ncbi:hypothetical protein BHYA_0023g00390 [Botrytis hyacinthi]|uniref:Uncharacterized protein n=1 Tax=Botrytis hyacinthi TaxID=278943 RepID=A0A4Z1GZQ5_9HELO|nr:hypothetical protein BHYA_0023g00390 [Botrytis hyacinthi]
MNAYEQVQYTRKSRQDHITDVCFNGIEGFEEVSAGRWGLIRRPEQTYGISKPEYELSKFSI